MDVPAREEQPAMEKDVIERGMLMLAHSAKKKSQSARKREGSLVNDGAFIVNFRKPVVCGHHNDAKHER